MRALAWAVTVFVVACGGPSAGKQTRAFQIATVQSLSRPPAPPPPPRVIPSDKTPDDPRALQVLRENLSSDPVALDQASPPELTKAALEDTARGEARGLELVDTIHVAQLDELRRAEIALPVSRGDCLTVIAHGGLGVMEVDAFLAEHHSNPPAVVAQDSRSGPIAVIGGLRGCYPFVRPESATLDVIVQARRGSGPVVFAVYRGRP